MKYSVGLYNNRLKRYRTFKWEAVKQLKERCKSSFMIKNVSVKDKLLR